LSCYLFVPGGKRKQDDWDGVRAALAARGQRTAAITLSDPEHSDLSRHISEVRDLIRRSDLRAVRLVGHSYAGLVITGAADAVPERIAGLVYVDTAIPENGKSLFDIFRDAGVDPAKYGVPSWPPFTEPLFFDRSRLEKIPKAYIHCLRSQFLEMTRDIPIYVKRRARRDNWKYFSMDSDHYCMLRDPEGLAGIILQA